jgi:hypothetical protein
MVTKIQKENDIQKELDDFIRVNMLIINILLSCNK